MSEHGGRLLVRRARLVPLDGQASSEPVDLRLAGGVVAETGRGLASAGEPELDAGGHWVIPGLWDAHVHFTQYARRRSWFDVAGTPGPEAVLERVEAALAGDPGQGVLTGFGYRSNAWARPASVEGLDAVSGDRPVVLIAGDAHNGWLNTTAQRLLGVGPFAGAVFEEEWFPIFDRLPELPGFGPSQAELRSVAAEAAARGVTGIVDLEFSGAYRDWPVRVAAGLDLLRVRVGVYEHQLAEVVAAGWHTGDTLEAAGLVTMGPHKIISDGSLGSRTAWCCAPYAGSDWAGKPNLPVERLAEQVRTATGAGLDVAVHAIGDRACQEALDAIAAAGARGSVEHAQLLRAEDVPRFEALGVVASVQPAHLADDRDLADASWPGRTGRCFPLRSLLDAGVTLAFGSDAPVAPLDPWGAMALSVHRSGDDRDPWHPEQSLTPAEALRASVDGRRLAPGEPADLVVLGADPLWVDASSAETAAHLRAIPVLATVCAGRVTWRAE